MHQYEVHAVGSLGVDRTIATADTLAEAAALATARRQLQLREFVGISHPDREEDGWLSEDER